MEGTVAGHDEYTHLKYRHYERFYRPEIKLDPALRSFGSRPTTVGPSSVGGALSPRSTRPPTSAVQEAGLRQGRRLSDATGRRPQTTQAREGGRGGGAISPRSEEPFDDGDVAVWARHNRTKKPAPLGCIYRRQNVPGPGHYGPLREQQQRLSNWRRGGVGLAKFARPGNNRILEPLCVSDLGPGQYASTVEEDQTKKMTRVRGTLQFGEMHAANFREGGQASDGRKLLPGYTANSPRLCAMAVAAPGPSITEHMRFRSEFDKDWSEGPHLIVSELPHNLDEFLLQRDLGPKKPIGFFSKESLDRTMRRILESDHRAPVQRKVSRTYTFTRSERM